MRDLRIWKNGTKESFAAQRTKPWYEIRAGRPTASMAKRIITATGKDSSSWSDYIIELCADSIRPDEISWEGNRHTDRGIELEAEARELFATTFGVQVRESGFCTMPNETFGCSPDGLIGPESDPNQGLEIKSPLPKNHAAYLITGKLPDEYKQQVHASMVATGLNEWVFMSYCPGISPFFLRVERDHYTEQVASAIRRFTDYYFEKRPGIMKILTSTNSLL